METFCCMRLRTAGIFLGCLGVILSIMGLVGGIVKVTHNEYKQNNAEDIISMVGTVINIITSILLVVGTMKNRHLMLLPWLISNFLGIIYSCVIIIILLIHFFAVSVGQGFLYLIIGGLLIAFYIYIYCAIYALYKELKSNSENTPPMY